MEQISNSSPLNEKTKYTHLIAIIFGWVVLILICVFWIWKLVQYYKRKIYDVYRLMQHWILIIYWIIILAVCILSHIDKLMMYTLTLESYSLCIFYFSEIVNMSCWVNIILQINWYAEANIFSADNARDIFDHTEKCK